MYSSQSVNNKNVFKNNSTKKKRHHYDYGESVQVSFVNYLLN